ncbi:LRR receptor kinase SERK2 [Camellia lanceoleosa]|nr:LRR receptor kinase SERK2 [Camellia lanceoleosa]
MILMVRVSRKTNQQPESNFLKKGSVEFVCDSTTVIAPITCSQPLLVEAITKVEDGEDQMKQVPGSLVRFSDKQLCVATENFKERLGGGAFGTVLKVMLKDGTQIAKSSDKSAKG